MTNDSKCLASASTPILPVTSDILYRQLGDEAVLLHIPSGNYFSLNSTAMVLWEAISVGSPESGIEKVALQYDVEPEQVRQDYLDLLDALCEHGLLSR